MRFYYQLFYLTFQANGLVERFNQTLQNILSKVSNAEKHLRDEFLDSSVYSTQYSPFQLMFGRQGLLPIDLDGGEPTLSDMEETRTTDVDNLQCLAVSLAWPGPFPLSEYPGDQGKGPGHARLPSCYRRAKATETGSSKAKYFASAAKTKIRL